MTVAGALGVLAVAVLGADPVLAQTTDSGSGTLYFTCYANQGTQGGNCTTGSDVQKATYSYSGGSMTVSSPSAVANTKGADGLAFVGGGDLVVGGQQSGLVSQVTQKGALVTQVKSGLPSADHVSVSPAGSAEYVTVGGYGGGGLALLPIKSGVIQPGIVCSISQGGSPVQSSNLVIDTIAWDGTQAYYTESADSNLYGGFGTFGAIAINYSAGASSCSATLTPLLTNFPAAHGLTFDPFSSSMILYGAQMIAQVQVNGATAATPVSEITFGGEACTESSSCYQYQGSVGSPSNNMFDQGAVDGNGHLFSSNNNGNLVFVDYSQNANHLLAGTSSSRPFVRDSFETTALDDVAPLLGPGGPIQIQTTASPATAVEGQPLSDTIDSILNATNAWPTNESGYPYVVFWLNGPNDPSCQAGSATMKSVWIPYYQTTGAVTWTPSSQYPAIDLSSGNNNQVKTWNPAWDSQPGTYRWVVDYYYYNTALQKMQLLEADCNAANEQVQVVPPSISTNAKPATGAVGSSFYDTATITNLPMTMPAPTVSFALFQGSSCPTGEGQIAAEATSMPVFTSSNRPVTQEPGNTGMAVSGTYTITTPGPYEWVAQLQYTDYTGANAIYTQCGSEQVGADGTPSLSTTPSAGGAIGTSLSDTATITGLYAGSAANDTVSFALYSNSTCSASGLVKALGAAAVGTPTTVGGVATWTVNSPAGFAPTVAQTYYWGVTFNSVNDQYNQTVTTCGEPVSITPAGSVQGAHTGGVLGASTPNTGADLQLPGLLASLALLLGGLLLTIGVRLRRPAA